MYHKLLKKLKRILDAHPSIVNDRDAIMKELIDVVNEAYEMGRQDGMG